MKITEPPTIGSKDNPRLKSARAVRDGREKGLIFIEGLRLASELLGSGLAPSSVYVSEEIAGKFDEIVVRLARTGAEVLLVATKIFDSITDTDNSQGIVVLAAKPDTQKLDEINVTSGPLVFLSRINNPSNLGAVVRTAEAAGAAGILTSPDSADPYSPKALRASMGSAFRLPILVDVEIDEAAKFAREKGIPTFAADIRAGKRFTEADWKGSLMLFFGSEAHGLDVRELELVDEPVFIPMENRVESLNLAVSAGILLFEAKRQRDSS